MLFSKSILSFLSLALLVSIGRVQGDDMSGADEACLNELAAYQACSLSSQAACDSTCDDANVKEPEFTAEDMLAMLTNPDTFWCDWWSKIFCNVQQCCNYCNDQANAYFACLVRDSTEGTCTFSCSGNGGGSGAVDGGSGGTDAGDGGSDNGNTGNDGSDTGSGGASDNGGDTGSGGAGEGADNSGGADDGTSSASPTLSMMMGWIGVAMVLGYRMI